MAIIVTLVENIPWSYTGFIKLVWLFFFHSGSQNHHKHRYKKHSKNSWQILNNHTFDAVKRQFYSTASIHHFVLIMTGISFFFLDISSTEKDRNFAIHRNFQNKSYLRANCVTDAFRSNDLRLDCRDNNAVDARLGSFLLQFASKMLLLLCDVCQW